MDDISHIDELAADGNLDNIDWRIKDITKKNIVPGMPEKMTAANFGNVSDIAQKSDIALGIMNLVYETIGMVSIFAARAHGLKDIVLTGNLTNLSKARPTFENAQVWTETYLDGFEGELYGRELKVEFVRYLRDIQKFESGDKLREQLTKDIRQVRNQ